MSGAGVELPGESETLAALSAIVDRLDHARPMWMDIGASQVTSSQRRFENGRAPDGSVWPPSVRALATGGKTMIESARLMQSITFNASDEGVEVGTNVIYAAVHQLGASIDIPARQQTLHFAVDKRTGEVGNRFVKKKRAGFAQDVAIPAHTVKMPARPFLGVDDDDAREILAIAEDFIAGQEARL